MKVIKKPLCKASKAENGGRNTTNTDGSVIKLRAISDAEREKLRIPTYQYLLP